jgi:uncharacterized damage-inducible protein DinB
MSEAPLRDSLLNAWATSARTTAFLVEHLPPGLWKAEIPGTRRRTVSMVASHLHNARCAWIRTLGRPHGLTVPPIVDRHRVTRTQLVSALERSDLAMAALLEFGCDRGGRIPPTPAYVWRNLPLDVGHVLSYFVAHEAHHRGQIVMVARQLGQRLPADVVNGLWLWHKRTAEARRPRAASRRG